MFDAMFRVIKESENVDERQHCFLIQTFGQQSHYFSVETRQVVSEGVNGLLISFNSDLLTVILAHILMKDGWPPRKCWQNFSSVFGGCPLTIDPF